MNARGAHWTTRIIGGGMQSLKMGGKTTIGEGGDRGNLLLQTKRDDRCGKVMTWI